jgi:Protein of unknown function (DUF3024)
MPLPADVRDAAIARVAEFCSARSTPDTAVAHRVRGNAITLVERQVPWRPGAEWSAADIAQLRYDPASRTWTLHWRRASGTWERYEDLDGAATLDTLLAEIDADPDGVFWG